MSSRRRLAGALMLVLAQFLMVGEWRGTAAASLHYEVYHLDLKGVEKYVKTGADINKKDADGRPPIFYCLFPAHPAKKSLQEKILKLLLNSGADVNAADRNGISPLMEALIYGNIEAAESMILHGADLQHRDHSGSSALHKAAGKAGPAFVEKFLQGGCDVNWKDKSGWTPLHEAAENGNAPVVAHLIKKGADVNALNEEMNTPLHLAVLEESGDSLFHLIKAGAKVSAQNLDGNTPLFLAIREDGDAAVQVLLESGSKVNVYNKEGTTPLHRAAYFGLTGIIGKLIENGADVNAATPLGITPLHLAVQWGHLDAARAIIDSGADLDKKTAPQRGGETPLHLAARLGNLDIIRVLLGKGASAQCADAEGKTPYQKALAAAKYGAAWILEKAEKSNEPYFFVISSPLGSGSYFATSSLGKSFGAGRAFDRNLATCWIGGIKGEGDSIAFYSKFMPKRIRIFPGWGTGTNDYMKNNRLKKVLFSLYAAEAGKHVSVNQLIYARELHFSDELGYHEFTLPAVNAPGKGYLGILKIKEIYPGVRGLTCIAEINPLQ